MKPPIIIYEEGNIVFYESVGSAELCIEAIDVDNHVYVAYDSEGCLLRLSTLLETVLIRDGESDSNHAEELRSRLVYYFSRDPNDKSLALATLPELVELGIRHFDLKME
ncbi:MAG: hypothetical protein PF692_07795 [Kiritimatiellae bacterium]|jgi:hypothetical protein|nr:hypothetical protein [Kiritimatiellia bacterium]